MTYQILIEKSALKQLSKLEERILKDIIAAIDALADDPRPFGYKKLVDQSGTYRIRVKNYLQVTARLMPKRRRTKISMTTEILFLLKIQKYFSKKCANKCRPNCLSNGQSNFHKTNSLRKALITLPNYF